MRYVPRERMAAIIERELPKYRQVIDHGETGGNYAGYSLSRGSGETSGLYGMAEQIARSTGQIPETVARRLYTIRTGNAKGRKGKLLPGNVSFDVADKILVGLGLPHLWHTELADCYAAAA